MALPLRHACAADPCTSYSDPSDPQAATCNSTWGFSKLFSGGNNITIFAPEVDLSNPPSTSNPTGKPGVYNQCYAIFNNSSDDLFVPWQTPAEWTSFLKAVTNAQVNQGNVMASLLSKGCCIPMRLTHTSCTVNGVTTLIPFATPLVLGNKTIGTPRVSSDPSSAPAAPQQLKMPSTYTQDQITFGYTEDQPFSDYGINEWGINGDLIGMTATKDANGNTIDYQILYTCDSTSNNPNYNDPTKIEQGYGGWIKLNGSAIGSCVPIDGSCASGVSSMMSLPSDMSTLCASGSIYQTGSLVTTQAGWSWQCNGTGGGGCGTGGTQQCQNAQCSALNTSTTNGECGADAEQNFTNPNANSPVTHLIASPTSLCASGIVSNLTYGPQNNPYYQWSCLPAGLGTITKTCSATDIQPVNGQCNTELYGGTFNTQQMNTYFQNCYTDPANCALCLAGAAQPPYSYNNTSYFWQWQCWGEGGGSTPAWCGVQEVNNSDIVAECGMSMYWTITLDPNYPKTNENLLCPVNPNTGAQESINNLTYVPNSQGGQWTWTCSINNTTSNVCEVTYYQSLVWGQCGSAAGQSYVSNGPGPSSAELCSYGTYNNDLSVSGQNWSWTCLGTPGVTQTNTSCNASVTASQQVGICSEMVSGACAYGTASPTTCDINNNCTWQCQGDNGTSQTSCVSSTTAKSSMLPTADGACGAANGEFSYIAPNANLCSSGQASAVSGTGPWTWTCNGTGGSTISASCMLNVCTQCSGQYTRNNSATHNYSSGSCTATATGSWTEVDDLVFSATVPGTVSWTDLLGDFSYQVKSTNATALSPTPGAPLYCQPCYLQLDHVTAGSASDTVTQASSACPFTKNTGYQPLNVTP